VSRAAGILAQEERADGFAPGRADAADVIGRSGTYFKAAKEKGSPEGLPLAPAKNVESYRGDPASIWLAGRGHAALTSLISSNAHNELTASCW